MLVKNFRKFFFPSMARKDDQCALKCDLNTDRGFNVAFRTSRKQNRNLHYCFDVGFNSLRTGKAVADKTAANTSAKDKYSNYTKSQVIMSIVHLRNSKHSSASSEKHFLAFFKN